MKIFSQQTDETKPRRRKRLGCGTLFLIGIAFSVVYSICSYIVFKDFMGDSVTKLSDHSVYKIEMKGTLNERANEDDPLAMLTEQMYGRRGTKSYGLHDMISNIREAKRNDKIEGIYLFGGSLAMGPSSAKELRDALLDFKQSGKWIVAYADSYAGHNYYVASVADKIYLNPVGSVTWHGFGAFKMYYTRLLEKIGVKMQIVKVGTFKSAVEPYFRTSMSEADKKQSMRYVQGLWDIVVSEVGESRGLNAKQLNAYADEFMELQPQEKYISYGLIDSLVYIQDMDSVLTALCGTDEYNVVSNKAMTHVERKQNDAQDRIAVIYAYGNITDEEGDGIVGTKMVKTIKKVLKNEDVKAVVLRVNSGGGSADASEQIWHAMRTLQQKGLPVVVSMGDYAASGGYYISCEADYIIAEPTTLTGSIGIFGMIPDFSGLRNKIGVDIDAAGTNKHTTMSAGMGFRPLDNDEYQLMQNMVERGYDLFTRRCAEGRGMSQDAIKAIAEGRVWLGTDALELGLVDSLGSMRDAISKAAELAGLENYKVLQYPRKKSYVEELMALLDEPQSEEEKIVARIKALCSQPRIMAKMPEVTIE